MEVVQTPKASPFKQPKAVWAIAFASVIAFMGIGLVSPILPSVAHSLKATQTETSLLFTSYLAITGIAMFFTSFISSRIGNRRTMIIGLSIIIVASALAGFSPNIYALIAFRAIWGLGNALFISTALSTIISVSEGSVGTAVLIYEAALGLGIAVGPLVGGLLGQIGWMAPFFGTAVLMLIAALSITLFMPKGGNDKPAQKASLAAPFKALAHPSILIYAIVAFCYNIGFFVVMSYTPFALGFTALGIGLVFTGWGVSVAITSVFAAPVFTRRFSPRTVLLALFVLFAIALVVTASQAYNIVGLIIMVIVCGLLIGMINTVLTECVMDATNLPRGVASSAYSGVRFIGGAIAPPVATTLAAASSHAAPYVFGALGVAVAAILTAVFAKRLNRSAVTHQHTPLEEAEAISLGED